MTRPLPKPDPKEWDRPQQKAGRNELADELLSLLTIVFAVGVVLGWLFFQSCETRDCRRMTCPPGQEAVYLSRDFVCICTTVPEAPR